MPSYIRSKFAGGMFFFTLVTFRRRPFLTTLLARQCLRQAWKEVCQNHPFELVVLCLLPDHLDVIIQLPENDADYALRRRAIKGKFTRYYLAQGGSEGVRNASRRKRGEAAVWQRRYWEHGIRDDQEFSPPIGYIHFNPVKHGHGRQPADWAYSTFMKFVKMGYYPVDWGGIEPDDLLKIPDLGE